jgi:DNA-binding response OmpR family regulator
MEKILIVDDELIGRQLLEAILVREGYLVSLAINGFEVIEHCKSEIPDLILLDIMMPEMNGFETITELKKGHLTKSIPIIAVTALDDRDSRIKSLEAGAVDFITKPFDRIELVAKIKNNINNRRSNYTDASVQKNGLLLSEQYNLLIKEIKYSTAGIQNLKTKIDVAVLNIEEKSILQKFFFRLGSIEVLCFTGTDNPDKNSVLILSLMKIWLINLSANDTIDLKNAYNYLNRKIAESKIPKNQFLQNWFVIFLVNEIGKMQIASYNKTIFASKNKTLYEIKPAEMYLADNNNFEVKIPEQIFILSDDLIKPQIKGKTIALVEDEIVNARQNSLNNALQKISTIAGEENSYIVRLMQ